MTENISNSVAALKGVPAQEQLLERLKNSVVEVTFTKLNGDRRVMECTLLPHMLPEPKKTDPLSQKKVREIDPRVISVWDVNAGGWRAFRYERVEHVEDSAYLETRK
jgi:hypothetical protein